MKTLILTFSLLTMALAGPIDEWNQFKKQYGKDYANYNEEKHRMNIFFKNKKFIEDHNAKFLSGQVNYNLKMNHLGDLESKEVKGFYDGVSGGRVSARVGGASRGAWDAPSRGAPGMALPDSVDWRQKGAVTPVQQPSQNETPGAFIVIGSLEGQVFMKTGKLIPLHVDTLENCFFDFDPNPYDSAWLCEDAFQWMNEDKNCSHVLYGTGAVYGGYEDLPAGDEEALKFSVATIGPICASFDASPRSFSFYSGGIYVEDECSSETPDKSILVVGYGSDEGQDYWLLKNSWGECWGEGGYMRMARNRDNMCGIATMAAYPKVYKEYIV